MLDLKFYIPVNAIVAIIAMFIFGCGFLAGYLFGGLAQSNKDMRREANRKKRDEEYEALKAESVVTKQQPDQQQPGRG